MEADPIEAPEIVRVDLETFRQHEREILDLEIGLIEGSSSEYLIDEADEMQFMVEAFEKGGYGYLVMENEKIIGFMVVGPLNDGTDLPRAVSENFPVEKCLHVKMMYIGKPGRGIGSSLMEKLIAELDPQWEYLFVRTWVNPPNLGAINFYTTRAGFQIIPNAIVESTKTRKDGAGTFQIQRQYFARKV